MDIKLLGAGRSAVDRVALAKRRKLRPEMENVDGKRDAVGIAMFVKAPEDHVIAATAMIISKHSYEMPQVRVLPALKGGNSDCLAWFREGCASV